MDARSTRCPSETGFTLIELLTVVAVIGVLSVIALQQVETYRRSSYDATAVSDLRNAVSAQEAYFATTRSYLTVTASGPGPAPLPGLILSDTVNLEMEAAGDSFNGSAMSSNGTGLVVRFDSTTGWIGVP
jgi:prepilin-type N-terminal cleavage/methylation domain-containing protein